MAELTKSDRLVEEVQHFALDLYDLLRSKGPGRYLSDTELGRQRRELADTLISKMLLAGPFRSERGHYFRAAGGPLVEYVRAVNPYKQAWWEPSYEVFSLDGPLRDSPYGWLYALSSATCCTLEEFEQAANGVLLGPEWAQLSLARAGERWAAAEQQLIDEGLLPLVTSQKSAVGGACYVVDLWVKDSELPAFREALKTVLGVIVSAWTRKATDGSEIRERDAVRRYTISVQHVEDLFGIGKLTAIIPVWNSQKGQRAR